MDEFQETRFIWLSTIYVCDLQSLWFNNFSSLLKSNANI